ncbi:MAG: hypothetical protein NTV97_08145 [Alphaproteobacteria bacterium]|nr:hypothetical protein [Alphaproteobacteria bacterium]
MFDILGEIAVWLLWEGFANLWRWFTEERALLHVEHAAHPDMASIRFVARLFLGLWLASSVAAAFFWFDPWTDSIGNFAQGVAGFLAGPFLMVWTTGLWRDRVASRLGKGG